MDTISEERRSWLMSQIKSENTTPEKKVRKLISSVGYRFTVNSRDFPGKPDILLKKSKKAVFVNGCFWHHHKNCKYAGIPKTRRKFWEDKFLKNIRRDRKNYREIRKLGFQYIVIWQCEIKNLDKLTRKLYKFLNRDINYEKQ